MGREQEGWKEEWRRGEGNGGVERRVGARRSKMNDICVWKSHNDLYALSKKKNLVR